MINADRTVSLLCLPLVSRGDTWQQRRHWHVPSLTFRPFLPCLPLTFFSCVLLPPRVNPSAAAVVRIEFSDQVMRTIAEVDDTIASIRLHVRTEERLLADETTNLAGRRLGGGVWRVGGGVGRRLFLAIAGRLLGVFVCV